jgi:cell pole-organizing protein PopZ
MTDWNEAASTTGAAEDSIGGAIASAAERGVEYVKTVAVELFESGRSAVWSVLDEQKEAAAQRIEAVAASVRSAAQSLDRAKSPILAQYADEAAGSIESFSRDVRAHSWGALVDDVAALAQRQPVLFIVGAVAAGFLTGRFLWASKNLAGSARTAGISEPAAVERETEAVTAAVSSAPGEENLTGQAADLSGRRELPR